MNFTAKEYILFTRDTAKLAEFYARAFGFKIGKNPHYKETDWLELGAGRGFKICLHRFPAPGSPKGNRNKLVLAVRDVGEARKHLVARGVKMGKHHQWPSGDACDGRDPDGNAFQIAGPPTG
jgi:predicted enzyme related to lactoylglutathione lyase